jgi:hypothetical protein
VRAVSEAHGGSLAIDPRAGGGLIVSVRLPRTSLRGDEAALGAARASARDSRPAARTRA